MFDSILIVNTHVHQSNAHNYEVFPALKNGRDIKTHKDSNPPPRRCPAGKSTCRPGKTRGSEKERKKGRGEERRERKERKE